MIRSRTFLDGSKGFVLAVNFTKLSREHQLEVISRSFHERM